QGQVVPDGDPRGEHVLVAAVAVVGLSVQVQRLQPRVLGQVQRPRIGGRRAGAALGARAGLLRTGSVGSVELQPAAGEHAGVRISEPPVDYVELLGGFVHQQLYRAGLLPVPAAEVVRTVGGV